MTKWEVTVFRIKIIRCFADLIKFESLNYKILLFSLFDRVGWNINSILEKLDYLRKKEHLIRGIPTIFSYILIKMY